MKIEVGRAALAALVAAALLYTAATLAACSTIAGIGSDLYGFSTGMAGQLTDRDRATPEEH